MSKIIREDCRNISIYKLREWGYLGVGCYHQTSIYWTNGMGEKKSDVGVVVDLRAGDDKKFKISYRIKHDGIDDWKYVEQEFRITTTKCNYGGVRCWFECSLINRGEYCGRRSANIYMAPCYNFFGCRHCFNLTYEARNCGYTYSLFDLNGVREKIKKQHYQGRITRKYKKYIKMQRSSLKYLTRIGLC